MKCIECGIKYGNSNEKVLCMECALKKPKLNPHEEILYATFLAFVYGK